MPTDVSQGEVRAEIERMAAAIPGEVRAVHAAVLAATGGTAGPHHSPRFYERKFLVKDVLTLRAAAIAVGHARDLAPAAGNHDLDRQLDALERWPALFSPSGEAYGSLRRTLANLPAGVPSADVCYLRWVTLTRPVTSALELSAICLSTRIASGSGTPQLHGILLEAKEEEIRQAIARVGQALRDPAPDMERVLRYLADCGEPHEGRLGGLVTKAIDWHRSWERRSLEEALRHVGISLPGTTPTAPPPFRLPSDAGVRFLASLEEVAREGEEMRHCVATRAAAALTGEGYLFHIDHEGQSATIEMSPRGELVEAVGPRNSRNKAVAWGKEVLRNWWQRGGRGALPEKKPAAARPKKLEDDWDRAARRILARTGKEPVWLAELARFRARVIADEQAATGGDR